MAKTRRSLEPIAGAPRSLRGRLSLGHELMLALLPAATVLLVFALVNNLSHQRLLFVSLAASAFLIYLDPQHGTNSVRTLAISQPLAALIGFGAYTLAGPGYFSAAGAIVITITLMIVLDAVHPPAIATALSFAFRSGPESNLFLFALAVGLVILLLGLQRATLWLLARYAAPDASHDSSSHENTV
jgi:CBS-domain-containing membrane protein